MEFEIQSYPVNKPAGSDKHLNNRVTLRLPLTWESHVTKKGLNSVYVLHTSGRIPLLNADGIILLTVKDVILQNCQNILTVSSISEDTIHRLSEEITSLADLPTLQETEKALKLFSNGNYPRLDVIPAEVYKADVSQTEIWWDLVKHTSFSPVHKR